MHIGAAQDTAWKGNYRARLQMFIGWAESGHRTSHSTVTAESLMGSNRAPAMEDFPDRLFGRSRSF